MPRYALSQRLLHWLIALMIFCTFISGTIFWFQDFNGTVETFGKELTGLLYKYHKTFGVLILGFMIVRIVFKIRLGKPAYQVPLTKFENAASNAIHGLIYLLVPVMAILGWLATGASGFPVEFFNWKLPAILAKDKALGDTLYWWHGVLGWVLMGLVAAHIGGALKHWLINKDGVMSRMGF
jgi:cytochrome b561